MIWRSESQALTRGWSFQRNTSSSDRRSASAVEQRIFARQILFRIHGGEGDAATNSDLVGRSAHLVGKGSARLEKTGRAGADHGGIGGESAGVDVVRCEAALEGNEIALPHGVAQLAPALDRLQLAVQKLLRGVHVAIDEARHGDGIWSVQGFTRCRQSGVRRVAQPGNAVARRWQSRRCR